MGNSANKQEIGVPLIYENYACMSGTFFKLGHRYIDAMKDLIQQAKTLEEKYYLNQKRKRVLKAMVEVNRIFGVVKALKKKHKDYPLPHKAQRKLQKLQKKYERKRRNLDEVLFDLFTPDADSNPRFRTCRSRKLALDGKRDSCVICMDEFILYELLEACPYCKNLFHRDCINKWLEDAGSCPLCRRKIARKR